jgi:hypothetical protein
MAGPSTLKSTRASSVGQRRPCASTTSTSKNATSEPSACKPFGPTCGVSLMAFASPAVSISSCATILPLRFGDGGDFAGFKFDLREGVNVAVLQLLRFCCRRGGLVAVPRDFPFTNSSTESQWFAATYMVFTVFAG